MRRIGIEIWVWVLLLVIAFVGLPMGVQAQSDDGLVAEWHFDEGSGSVLKDSSENGNDGTIYGATWVEGKFGYALQFDGIDDKVKLPYSVIDGLTDVTSEFWIKTTDTNAGIITGANSASKNEYLIYWECANQIRNDIKNINHEISVSTITDGNWHHVAAIRTVSEVSIYIDGYLEGFG